MDIITHIVSGAAVGTVFSAFAANGFYKKTMPVLLASVGAALPDFDTISLWPAFDGTIGRIFNLSHAGKEIYFSKYWYSHHGAMHSITAALLIALISGLLLYFLVLREKQPASLGFANSLKFMAIPLSAFVAGFTIHLVEDMLTPAYVWGGVWFFWPFGSFVGGTGHIWWWNNYDIFLVISGVLFVNTILLLLGATFKWKIQKFTLLVLFASLSLSFIQVKTRNFDFNYTGHTPKYDQYEQKSKEIQREILGEKLYKRLAGLDNKIPLHF